MAARTSISHPPKVRKAGQLLTTDQLCVLIRPIPESPTHISLHLNEDRLFAFGPLESVPFDHILERNESGGPTSNDQRGCVERQGLEIGHGLECIGIWIVDMGGWEGAS